MLPITVILPIWGEQYTQYLQQRMDEILNEGVAEADIVIVCDISLNLDSWPQAIRVDRHHDESIGQARNRGLQHVQQPWIVFCDADDQPVPGAWKILYEAATSTREDVSLVHGATITPDGLPYQWPPAYKPGKMSVREKCRQLSRNRLPMETGAIVNTSAIQRTDGFLHGNLHEDGTLATALAANGTVIRLGEPTRIYHHNPTGLSQGGHSPAQWREAFKQGRRYLYNADIPFVYKFATVCCIPGNWLTAWQWRTRR